MSSPGGSAGTKEYDGPSLGFRCLSTSELKPRRLTSVWKSRTTANWSMMYLSMVEESQRTLLSFSPDAVSLRKEEVANPARG